jgi:hypothetical protein
MQPVLQPVTIDVSREVVYEIVSQDALVRKTLGDVTILQDWVDVDLTEGESFDGDMIMQTLKRTNMSSLPPEEASSGPRFQTLDHASFKEECAPVTNVSSLKSAFSQSSNVQATEMPYSRVFESSPSYIPSEANGDVPLQVIKSVPQLITTLVDGREPYRPLSPVTEFVLPAAGVTRVAMEEDALSLTPSNSPSQQSHKRAMSHEAAYLLSSLNGSLDTGNPNLVLGPVQTAKMQPLIKTTVPEPITQMQIPKI